jgi:hypothetical protein
MPIPEELFDSIGESNIFTIMDLRQGFNQIVLVTKEHKKTTFLEQQVMGMACDAFWIEKYTCLLLANHGFGFRKGRFHVVLHK